MSLPLNFLHSYPSFLCNRARDGFITDRNKINLYVPEIEGYSIQERLDKNAQMKSVTMQKKRQAIEKMYFNDFC